MAVLLDGDAHRPGRLGRHGGGLRLGMSRRRRRGLTRRRSRFVSGQHHARLAQLFEPLGGLFDQARHVKPPAG